MPQVRAITDGFDLYPSSVSQTGYGFDSTWMGNGNRAIVAGRFEGQAAQLTGDSPGGYGYRRRAFPATTQIAVGFAFRRAASLVDTKAILQVESTTGAGQFFLGYTDTGHLFIRRGGAPANNSPSSGELLALATANPILGLTWHYIEVEVFHADVGGFIKVYLDGFEVPGMSYSGDTRTTADAELGRIALWVQGTGAAHLFDDLYVEVGGAVRVGEGRIESRMVDSDVSGADWTPSVGSTRFGVLDELPANHTDFVSATPVGAEFRCGVANLSTVPQTIYGVQIESLSQKDEAGTRAIRNKLWSGAVEWDGETQALQLNSFTFKRDWLARNPEGDVAWAAAAVNALELGQEIVT